MAKAKRKKSRQKQKLIPGKKLQLKKNDTIQLLVGALHKIYTLINGNTTHQGWAFVETLSRGNTQIGTLEHYSLFSSFSPPRVAGDRMELRFESTSTFNVFLLKVREYPTNRYIEAHCLDRPIP